MITKEQAKEKLCCANAHMNLDEDDCFELYELIESQAKIIDKLPKYVDGTPFVPGVDKVWYVRSIEPCDVGNELTPHFCPFERIWMVKVDEKTYTDRFFKTYEDAEKAAEKETIREKGRHNNE